MKTYQKAELIAKNLPTGSYAAGCPSMEYSNRRDHIVHTSDGCYIGWACERCELAG